MAMSRMMGTASPRPIGQSRNNRSASRSAMPTVMASGVTDAKVFAQKVRTYTGIALGARAAGCSRNSLSPGHLLCDASQHLSDFRKAIEDLPPSPLRKDDPAMAQQRKALAERGLASAQCLTNGTERPRAVGEHEHNPQAIWIAYLLQTRSCLAQPLQSLLPAGGLR